jgi:hypothetical protein
LKQRDTRRLKTAEVKFRGPITGYSLQDYRRNEDILEEIKADPVEMKLGPYKQELLNYISRIEGLSYPKQILDYRSIGRRRPGRPLKRLLDGYSGETETGHLLA